MTRIVSGIQPTNKLHLGNYLGAVKNWVSLQTQHECYLFVADLHALTVPQDPKLFQNNVRSLVAAYIAAGIDPDKCVIFRQSDVPGHTELNWILSCLTPIGWLNRMTQFKEKAGKQKEKACLGLYAYPVLMAADILLYHATHVPVGEDQKQHLELARDIAGAFNQRYDTAYFTLPEPQIFGTATRVMSLRDGTKKMSKSAESDYSRINITDTKEDIVLKIRKARTDGAPLPDTIKDLENRPEARNLITLFAALSDQTVEEILKTHAGIGFGQFKPLLTDLIIDTLTPVSTKMNQLLNDGTEIDSLLAKNAEKAREIANKTLKDVREMLGL